MMSRITITRKRKRMIFASAIALLLCGVATAGGIPLHSHYLSVRSSDIEMAEDMKEPVPNNEKLSAGTEPEQLKRRGKTTGKQANTMIKIVQIEKEKANANIENETERDTPDADLLPDISYSKKAQLEDAVNLLYDLTD